jgi:hypothetical protein
MSAEFEGGRRPELLMLYKSSAGLGQVNLGDGEFCGSKVSQVRTEDFPKGLTDACKP